MSGESTEPFDKLVLKLNDGTDVQCSTALLCSSSNYFAAMMANVSFVESATGVVDLSKLDSKAVRFLVHFLQWLFEQQQSKVKENQDILQAWNLTDRSSTGGTADVALAEAIDYLHIEVDDTTPAALHIFCDPNIILSECKKQGWVYADSDEVLQIPSNKKKREWRFWVCFLLCLQIMPIPNENIDQELFTKKLGNLGEGGGGAVALRRELIEYGLIDREGDGSVYWRPPYTLEKLGKWTKGLPRKVI